jgi:N-acetylglutamate synthase-like GNAT family acetyltransferase
MNIRPYMPADREECLRLFKSNMPRYFDPSELKAFEEFLAVQDKEYIEQDPDKDEFYFVMEENGRVLACGGFYIPPGGSVSTLTWGMVDNGLHRKGLGRTFLEYRISAIQEQFPAYTIALDTTQHAHGFFKKFGFKLTSIQKDFFAPGMDKYNMER